MAAKGRDQDSKINLKMLYKQLHPCVSTSIAKQNGELRLYLRREEFAKLCK